MTISPEDVATELRWDVEEARQFCVELLTDCNDHSMVEKIEALFEAEEAAINMEDIG